MSITLTKATEMLNAWLAAELAVSKGQSYKIGKHELVRANLSEITKKINYWRNEVSRLTSGRSGARVMRVVPRDL